jgi:hypothetical protein
MKIRTKTYPEVEAYRRGHLTDSLANLVSPIQRWRSLSKFEDFLGDPLDGLFFKK